jgi:hypothetical protein
MTPELAAAKADLAATLARMGEIISDAQRRRIEPGGWVLAVRVDPVMEQMIARYALAAGHPSRAAAVRSLIALGLAAAAAPGPAIPKNVTTAA